MLSPQRLSPSRLLASRRRPGKRGFTLIELIVVIGITAILMSLMFVPLLRSLELSKRGEATMRAQDEVRRAVRRMNTEIGSAVQVLPPRDLQVWGYNQWTEYRNRPRPAPGATPQAYLVRNALITLRLPKKRYYCTTRDHYLTQQDIDELVNDQTGVLTTPQDLVALGDCPRPGHEGSPVELRPQAPVEPDTRYVAYFIGLNLPGRGDPDPARDDAAYPVYYENFPLFGGVTVFPAGGGLDFNAYNLYRVEFEPTDPRFSNFANADFFYDDTPVNYQDRATGQQRTRPRYDWWRDQATVMMSGTASDVVRWVRSGANFVPQSLVTFSPSPVADETGQPNRAIGQYALSSASPLPSDLPATDYTFDFGNWLDIPNLPLADGAEVVPTNQVIGTNGGVQGPRIQVFEGGSLLVYDSQDLTVQRRRLLGYDSLTGRVVFAIQRRDLVNANPNNANYALIRDFYSAPIDPANYIANLSGDTVTDTNGMPRGFGSARANFPSTFIVPGSDEVQLVEPNGTNAPLAVDRLRLAGWIGLPNSTLDRPVYQGDLAPDEYVINYSTGEILLSDKDPSRWVGVGPGQPKELRVRYAFQTNSPNDVVRASYVTREQYLVNCGVVEYTKGRGESLPFSVAERVVIRNQHR